MPANDSVAASGIIAFVSEGLTRAGNALGRPHFMVTSEYLWNLSLRWSNMIRRRR